MPEERSTVVYRLDTLGVRQPGRLIRINDIPGGHSDVYFHPLHIRAELVDELNRLGLHQVGHGLWRQRWTGPDRVDQPAEGFNLAESSWEIVPAREMPKRRCIVPIEEDGSCIWHIKAGYCTAALAAEMNQMLERIVGDGLWCQSWHEEQQLTEAWLVPSRGPVLTLACA